MEFKLQVKPLSANKMYLRNRHKTADYKNYQMEIYDELRGVEWTFGDETVSFKIEAAFSTRAADLDNVLKPLLDTFQHIFSDFNDNKVYNIEAYKTIVPKGEEYIRVWVRGYDSSLLPSNQEGEGQSKADTEKKQSET